ncbi:IclR family transcriptional regulator [Corynebacterium phocae]|uniref:IclR family transcriptional regulator n=1 Tax=Corynebacterium phocae TaxID=161895 RepID=A0A1L7D3D0_9CORY|nr:IclR family transcriptional regulator [Corynebacterium phocae]APT92628.1 IclR family transcriptional regulator [Corynebacterium phocae]KAA8724185.1 IclR family transcriptional regulator [Corynebacterium phocae]
MGEYSAVSGIKVLDRAVAIMLAATNKPSTLQDLCDTTGLPRATAHRLATALEAHRIIMRNSEGKWTSGPALPGNRERLIEIAEPIMEELLVTTGESIQLYQHTGDTRTCIAAKEPRSGLHNVVPVGRQLPLDSGSGARVIAAFGTGNSGDNGFFPPEELEQARSDGFAESMEEREAGLASISAPVLDPSGTLMAVLSISGSAERFSPSPAQKFGQQLCEAASALGRAL